MKLNGGEINVTRWMADRLLL